MRTILVAMVLATTTTMAACGTGGADDIGDVDAGASATCEPTADRRRSCERVCSLGGVPGDASKLQLCANVGEFPAAACMAECNAGVSAGTWCP